ncbi:hypothetical protein ACHAXT_001430 [Thalassiosira profunda]
MSRKRNQGRSRRKAKAENLSGNNALELVTATRRGCLHGFVQPADQRQREIAHRCVNVFIDAWRNAFCGSPQGAPPSDASVKGIIDSICDESPRELWEDSALKQTVKGVFLLKGIEELLNEDGESRLLCAICLISISMLENDMAPLEDKQFMRLHDATSGCKRTMIKFFRKRASCSCLDTMYAELKASNPTTAVCDFCSQRKERCTVMLCAGCRRKQYCGRECQVAHWPEHKVACKEFQRAAKEIGRA